MFAFSWGQVSLGMTLNFFYILNHFLVVACWFMMGEGAEAGEQVSDGCRYDRDGPPGDDTSESDQLYFRV